MKTVAGVAALLILDVLLMTAPAASRAQCDASAVGATGSAHDVATNHCYYAFATAVSWPTAEAACEGIGGYLAVIDSVAENTVARSAASLSLGPWIGFHDQNVEAGSNAFAFEKVTGGYLSHNGFGPGEPNNLGDEDCVHFFSGASDWNDLSCSNALAYLCEVPSLCGDEIVDVDEGCDDANTANGDGCSAACELESCTPPPSGLIAWWSGDGTTSDITGNGHAGTLTGGGYAAGNNLQAFNLDGAGHHVEVADDPELDLTTGMTIDAWVYPRGDGGIISKENMLDDGWQLGYQAASQRVYFQLIENGTASGCIPANGSVPLNAWTHLAVSTDGVTHTTYVNGMPLVCASTVSLLATNEPLLIGALRRNGVNEQFFNGLIDEVEIFDRVLSAAEVQAIYAAGTGGKCKPCGDGVVSTGQECDDNNTASGDGCDSSCQVEPCHECGGAPSACLPLADGTACDDGNACTAAEACMGGYCQASGEGGGSVLGGQLYASGGAVEVEVLPSSAGSDSDLYLFEPGPPVFIATNRDTGTVVNLGSFAVGTELVFGIYVADNGHTFKMGPATRNPDGMIHAQVETISAGVIRVSFEDLFGFADDYNDNVFEFRGGISPTSCDDSNPCTADICDPETGCSASPHPLGFPCPNDGEICTSDQCDGAGSCAHPAGNAGALCRSVGGDCDVAEFCDGSNVACPADGVAPASTLCGDPTDDDCTDPDTCDGAGSCQGNHASGGTPCPDDGEVCTTDQCDGAGSCQHPAGNAGTECSGDAGQCDVAEVCDGSSPSCPPNGFEMNGTSCNDGNPCTQTDQCQSGTCTGSSPLLCDDLNPCTVDSCSPGGGCVVAEVPRSGCRGADKSILSISSRSDDHTLDNFLWRWNLGDATSQAEFGNPVASASYTLCVYESGKGLLWRADVPPSMTLWKPLGDKGWKYKDMTGMANGLQKIQLKASTEARARVLVKGKGMALPDPTLGNLVTPVTAQLHNSDSGLCWEAVYTAPKKNGDTQFKAKAP